MLWAVRIVSSAQPLQADRRRAASIHCRHHMSDDLLRRTLLRGTAAWTGWLMLIIALALIRVRWSLDHFLFLGPYFWRSPFASVPRSRSCLCVQAFSHCRCLMIRLIHRPLRCLLALGSAPTVRGRLVSASPPAAVRTDSCAPQVSVCLSQSSPGIPACHACILPRPAQLNT